MNAPLLPDEDKPLRIKVVAEWLGISEKTVRRRIDSGEIESVKMGGLRVVPGRNLKAYLEKLNQPGGQRVQARI